MIAGGVAAGLPGAFAGLSLVGATRNALRAQSQWSSPIEEQRIEAGHAAVMSAIGFAVVGYLTYQAYKSHYGIQEIT